MWYNGLWCDVMSCDEEESERRARSPVHAAAAADALGGAWRSRIAQSERDSQLAFSVDLMNFARHVGP